MKFIVTENGAVNIELSTQETAILSNLVSQLLALLQSHSSLALDPDPLFARNEIGGTDTLPEDPALARLLPNAYLDPETAGDFRRVTEQGLINRKIEDAFYVATTLTAEASEHFMEADPYDEISADIPACTFILDEEGFQPWVRTLTALRLSIAARIGVNTEEDHETLRDDPAHADTFIIYEWLAALTDMMLRFASVIEESAEEEDDAE